MKRIINISLFLVLVLAYSCDKVTEMTSQSYAQSFYSIDFIDYVLQKENNSITVCTRGDFVGSLQSKGKEKLKYQNLCEKFNDLSYNKEVRFIMAPTNVFLAEVITGIDIISDTDFGDDCPAGASLGNIVFIDAYSAYDFVQGGYKSKDPSDDYSPTNWTRINKRISELGENDLALAPLHYITFLSLNFDLIPEEKNHNLTVTLTLDDGRVLTKTFAMQFE